MYLYIYTFGRRAVHAVDVPNRDLLVEFCESTSMVVANTFADVAIEEKMTYMEPGTRPMQEVSATRFNLLDLVVCDNAMLANIRRLHSVRAAVLRSDHFLVRCVIQTGLTAKQASTQCRKNREALRDTSCREQFATVFRDCLKDEQPDQNTLEEMWSKTKASFCKAEAVLPPPPRKANHPWISDHTLEMIDMR